MARAIDHGQIIKLYRSGKLVNSTTMSQKNGFGSGFILGSIIGGVVGGLLGTVLATRNEQQISEADREILPRQSNSDISFGSEESIELARHGLEDKIAQLNLAIDDVKQQLNSVQINPDEG